MGDRFCLGPLSVEIDSFGHRTLWPFWNRPLDSYKKEQLQSEGAVLRIFNAFGEHLSDDWESLGDLASGFYRPRLYRNTAGEYRLDYTRFRKNISCIRLIMNAEMDEIRLLMDDSGTGGMMAFSLLGRLIPYPMLKSGAITFHGVLLESEGRGIILSAPSGTGKTTHARLWRDNRHALIINGDRAACCRKNGIWTGFGQPWCGSSGECINREVPISAFVVLEQAAENHAERLSGLEAFSALMPNLIYPFWSKELSEITFNYIDGFIREIPIFRLSCRPDAESVDVLDRALRGL